MLTAIINNIENKNYKSAIDELVNLLNHKDEKIVSTAHYLLGYINVQYDYENKNIKEAKKHLYFNLNSNHPIANGYVLYSKIEEDPNIAINYLRKGIEYFPENIKILSELLQLSKDKIAIIDMIDKKRINNTELIGQVISQLISDRKWDKILPFIDKIECNTDTNTAEINYLNLIKAYAHLFSTSPNYINAIEILEKVISIDVDNELAYSHYLGIIYAYIKCNNIIKATEFFDKIPVNNSIRNIEGWEYHLGIDMSFEYIYPVIFKSILSIYVKDNKKKLKSKVLYSLYLYYTSELYGEYSYKKSDISTLKKYLKISYNENIVVALYEMRCHFKQYEEAYEELWVFLKNYRGNSSNKIYFSQISYNASNIEICNIARKTIEYLKSEYLSYSKLIRHYFISNILSKLIERLFEIKEYDLIYEISKFFSIDEIFESKCAFKCAYANAEKEYERAIKIYERIVNECPEDSSAINNLGVLYENLNKLDKAFDCYEKAVLLNPNNIHTNNLSRIKKLIYHETERKINMVIDNISVHSFEEIGYTDKFRHILFSIKDDNMRDIIQRDVWECALAVVSGQNKAATILSGSIIESLLILKLKENDIEKYDISEIKKNSTSSGFPVDKMGLNELLYVADKNKIIDKSNYHLGHYIRDYRNIVHPAKELKMDETLNHDTVITMWNILKRLVFDLYSTNK